MNSELSYSVEVLHIRKYFKTTTDIFREAVSYMVDVVEKEWNLIKDISGSRERRSIIEKLIHSTKDNPAKYDFDDKFPKFPVYLRREVATRAIGAVSSYHSNYRNWENNGRVGNPPKLSFDQHMMPCFFRDNMFLGSAFDNEVSLKLYIDNDWKYLPIKLKKTDVNYIRRHWTGVKESAPTLEKRHGKYFLRFLFKKSVTLSDTPIFFKRILSVDLGINTDAVCTVMESNGTVLLRKFIDFGSEKDYINHQLNKLKKFQRRHGSKNVKSRWENIRRHNIEHGRLVGNAIAELAALYNCDVIVFEYLDTNRKKIKGSKKQKLALWRKNSIQKVCTSKAHAYGIRISRICAWGTSKLAYDGSGTVERDKNNHSLATFQNGKKYNADLSASYNIGARYFIRELLKPLSVKIRSQLLAKVPEAEHRTSCTYSTLLKLYPFIEEVMCRDINSCFKLAL